MALRAKRDPTSTGARQVLHDALLEQFGYYNFLVERAHRASTQDGVEKAILFLPAALKKKAQSEFFLMEDNPDGEAVRTLALEEQLIKEVLRRWFDVPLGVLVRTSAVLVYRTRGYL